MSDTLPSRSSLSGSKMPSGEGFFRISLTIDDDRLAEAVERLRSSLSGG